ncbi:MAG: polysaccharide deacetylase family protein [Thaumarchaeota archaeon]|nr:polysaccharide deacetylase family protein [Nitrososphaerota archaeon]
MLNPYYEYSAIVRRHSLKWPNNARVAVIVTVNFECWDLQPRSYGGPPIIGSDLLPPDAPDVPNFTWREYGQRVGIFRIANMLDNLGIKASVTLNALAGERYPVIIEEMKKRDWEFIAHCYKQDDLIPKFKGEEEERQYLQKVLDTFRKVVGHSSEGWLSTGERSTLSTPKILADFGLKHFSDYQNDDQPYFLNLGNNKRLLSIPYTSELNDYRCIRSGLPHTALTDIIKDEFDVLYEEGAENARLMNIGLHPHVSGRAHRIKALRPALEYMKNRKGVWFALRKDIYDWCVINLNPSPDSNMNR